MMYLCKVLAVLLGCTFLITGEKLDTKRTLPVEVLLNTKENERRLPVPVGSLIKDRNKDIKLQIRSDESGEGKLNLIIAATKGNQNTDKNIERYSPAYNAEHDLVNGVTSRNSKSTPEMNRNWDSSRLDSSMFYPSQNAEMFPYLTLRQVLQSQHPLRLQQNRFSPLQSLKYFEDNLQRQFLPHMTQSFGSLQGVPMGMLMSQPFHASGGSLNQRLPNIQQNLNGFQQGLEIPFQLNNRNIPIGVSHQVTSLQNPPLDKYPLVNTYRQNKHPSEHGNSPQNNGLSYQSNTPSQHNSEHLRIPPSQNNNIPRSIPIILAPNKQPIPPHNRPQYTLERNYQNIPLQRNVKHQQPTSPQHNNFNVPQVNRGVNNGIQNYQSHQNPRINSYQQIPNKQPYEQLYHTRQQTEGNHPQRVPNPIQNNQPVLYRPQNVQNSDHGRTNNFQDRYRLPLRELNDKDVPVNRPGLYPASRQGSYQSQLANSFQNPSFRNEHVANLPDDANKRPVYNRSPERSRPLHSQNYAHMSVNDHHRNPGTTVLTAQPQNNFSPDQTRLSPPQLHQVHSYPLRNTDVKSSGLHGQINESREARPKRRRKYKVDEVYDSSAPPKKRKLKRQRVPKKRLEDVDGHSSHEYVTKIR